MIPISRVEMYLAKICGEDVELPIPQTRKEVFLAIIAGESYEKPVPSSRVELYLAKILGDDVPLPIPQSREEIFLAKIAGVEYPLPYPESRIEYWLHKWATYEEWSTISGNPVSFTAKAAPLKQLSVAFSPVQDLHGYDSPWPAGGGKNKLSISPSIVTKTQYGVTFTINRNSAGDVTSIVANGTSTTRNYFSLGRYDISGGTVLNGCPAGGAYGTYTLGIDGTTISDTGNGATIESDMTNAALQIVIARDYVCNNLTFKPMIRLASVSDATYSPYSNECPISGWDSLTVTIANQNVVSESFNKALGQSEGSYVVTNTAGTSLLFRCVAGTTYYLLRGAGGNRKIWGFFKDKPAVSDFVDAPTIDAWSAVAPLTGWCMVYLKNAWDETLANTSQVSITEESTVVPPVTRSISINLGQTVYSGVLDVVTGVGEVTMAGVHPADYLSTASLTSVGNGYSEGRVIIDTGMIDNTKVSTMKCDSFKYGSSGDIVRFAGFNNQLYFKLAGEMTLDEWKAEIGTINPFVVYPRRDPIPIQLTPQEVQSLAGDNTMWSNANQPITVEYRKN